MNFTANFLYETASDLIAAITLIPPESITEVIEAVRDVPEMRRLMEMLVVAEREWKFVIHFGV